MPSFSDLQIKLCPKALNIWITGFNFDKEHNAEGSLHCSYKARSALNHLWVVEPQDVSTRCQPENQPPSNSVWLSRHIISEESSVP